MIVTIAIVALCASIAAFFAQEFGRVFKKIFAIPGLKLLLPLTLASWFIEVYEDWGHWLLLRIQYLLHLLIHRLGVRVPFEKISLPLIKILFLFLIGILPMVIFKLATIKQWGGKRLPQTYWIGLILWVFAAILLTLSVSVNS